MSPFPAPTAAPIPPPGLLTQLDRWGVPYAAHAVAGVGWADHVRPGPWGPVGGLLVHHTGSDTADPTGYALGVLWAGYTVLPGPLAQAGIADDGTLHLVGGGRANHAGYGDAAVLDASVAGLPLPAPRYGQSTGAGDDGNTLLYGAEIMYAGQTRPPTPEAYRAATRWAAALCEHHGWTAARVLGHREWSRDKSDPGHVDMDRFRADVDALLTLGPTGATVRYAATYTLPAGGDLTIGIPHTAANVTVRCLPDGDQPATLWGAQILPGTAAQGLWDDGTRWELWLPGRQPYPATLRPGAAGIRLLTKPDSVTRFPVIVSVTGDLL